MNTDPGLSQQIADRINCYGISDWLRLLAGELNMLPHDLIPIQATVRHEVECNGLCLRFHHPHAGHVTVADPQRWEMAEAKFNLLPGERGTWREALPYDLDPEAETPESAQQKLSDETSPISSSAIPRGDRRIAYFMDDARVVELTFRAGMVGLERVYIVRLGSAQDYANVSNAPSNSEPSSPIF